MLAATHSAPALKSPTWEECAVTLTRNGSQEAAFQLYRHAMDGTWTPWHLVTTGRYFATPADACAHLVRTWDDVQTPEEAWNESRAQANYEAGYACACGYHD